MYKRQLHSQAVELVGAAEVPAGTEGGDGHDVAVLQHGSITGGIAQGVALAVHGNAAGREKIESQPPLLEIAADGIIDIPGDPRVLIEQDLSLIHIFRLYPGAGGLPAGEPAVPGHSQRLQSGDHPTGHPLSGAGAVGYEFPDRRGRHRHYLSLIHI